MAFAAGFLAVAAFLVVVAFVVVAFCRHQELAQSAELGRLVKSMYLGGRLSSRLCGLGGRLLLGELHGTGWAWMKSTLAGLCRGAWRTGMTSLHGRNVLWKYGDGDGYIPFGWKNSSFSTPFLMALLNWESNAVWDTTLMVWLFWIYFLRAWRLLVVERGKRLAKTLVPGKRARCGEHEKYLTCYHCVP